MKILQVCHKPPHPAVEGGAIAMNYLAKGLKKTGHQIDVIAMSTHKQYCNPEYLLKVSRQAYAYVKKEHDYLQITQDLNQVLEI